MFVVLLDFFNTLDKSTDQQDLLTPQGQTVCQGYSSGGLSHATFLVCDCDDGGQ
jgi:hypothetical protein